MASLALLPRFFHDSTPNTEGFASNKPQQDVWGAPFKIAEKSTNFGLELTAIKAWTPEESKEIQGRFNIKNLLPPIEWQEKQMIAYRTAKSNTTAHRILEAISISFNAYIEYIATRRWRRARECGGLTGLRDVIAAGKEGLLIALDRWQPNRKPLCHLASIWITENCKQETFRLGNQAVTIPGRIRVLCKEYRAKQEESADAAEKFLENSKCRAKTRQIIKTLAPAIRQNTVSMEEKRHDDPDAPSVQDWLPDPDSQSEDRRDLYEQVRNVIIAKTNPRERLIIYLKHPTFLRQEDVGTVIDKNNLEIPVPETHNSKITLETIGSIIGITRERVRQIYDTLLETLEKELGKIGICRESLAYA